MSCDKQVQQGSHSEDFSLSTPAAGAAIPFPVSPPALSNTPAFCFLKLPSAGSQHHTRPGLCPAVHGRRQTAWLPVPLCAARLVAASYLSFLILLLLLNRYDVPLFSDPVDHSPPGSSVHGISQARILEWVALSFSRGSS